MQYDRVLIYTKKGNLLSYMHTDKVMRSCSNGNKERLEEYYGKERNIQLVAKLRWETNGQRGKAKCICKILCPINPLPVEGEFTLPSLDALRMFLNADGWELKQDVCACLFK